MTLRDAIQSRDLLRFRQLLRDGADPHQPEAGGESLLTWAFGTAGVPFLRALIEARVALDRTDSAGDDALDRAVKARRKNVFKLIVDRFPAARVAEIQQRLPFFHIPPAQPRLTRRDPLDEYRRLVERAQADPRIGRLVAAARAGDVAAARQLLDEGADPDAPAPNPEILESPVWAALFARKAHVLRLLADAGADLNEGFPRPPLCAATNWGHIELLRILIDGGADVNHAGSSLETPLLCAVQDQPAVVAELVNMGADPNFIPKKKSYDTITNYSPLQLAGTGDNKEILKLLVAAGGSRAEGLEALLLCNAASTGDLAAVKQQLEQGVDVNAKDSQQRTPLICAAEAGKVGMLRLLLAQGADVNLPAGAKKNGHSPLIAAALSGNVNAVRVLIEAGADLDYEPKHVPGGTALAYAKEERLKKVVDYLLEVNKTRGRRRAPTPTPRGVPTFDTNDATLLVAAPVEAVAAAWAERIGAGVWSKNVLGRKVKLTRRCYAVWKIAGQPWTAVMKLCCEEFKHWPRLDDAAALARTLETRALFVANSDTAGVAQYALFDKAALVEFFDYGTAPEKATAASVVRQFDSTYGLDLSDVPNLQVKKQMVFASSRRRLDLATVKNDLDFINDSVKQLDAFIPFFVDEWGRPGQRVEMTLEGFGPDDIERLDYVAVD